MNAEANTAPLAASSADLEKRIDDERRRLLIEQNLQVNLEGQRLAPLEAGDDEALDRVEAQINSCCDRQARIQERIEILQRRLEEAKGRENEADLDALAARADRIRIIGEKAIAKYAELAAPLAQILHRLAAADALINAANRKLHAAGRAIVASPNDIRCRPAQRFDRTVKRTVGIGQREHPHHDDWSGGGGEKTAYLKSGGDCPRFMEVDIVEHVSILGHHAEPLHETVVLPGIVPAAEKHGVLPIFDGTLGIDTDEDAIRVLETEVDEGAIGKIKKFLGGSK
jgi:hypothetical protein